MRRDIVPRTTEPYDTRQVRKNRGGNLAGLFSNIFNPKIRVMTFQGFGDEGQVSTFRPLPPLDLRAPTTRLASGRLSVDPGHFSHWQQVLMIAKWIGLREERCQRTTLMLGRPGDGQWGKRPYHLLYRAIANAKRGRIADGLQNRFDIQWLRLLEGDSRGSAALPATSETFFVQSAIYRGAMYDLDKRKNVYVDYMEQRDQPLGFKEEDPLPVFVLTKGTGYSLISGHEGSDKRQATDALFDRRKANYDPDSDDYGEVFFFGDPVGTYDEDTRTVAGGVFVNIFMPTKGMEVPKLSTWDGEIAEFQPYEAQVSRKYRLPNDDVITADLSEDQVDQVFDKFQFWDESTPGADDGLIRTISVEEEATLVVKAFMDAKLFRYVWAANPEFFTDEVNGILAGRVTMVNPKARVGDDEPEDASVDEEVPAPTPAPKKDKTLAAASGQRPAVGSRKPAPRHDDDEDDGGAPPAPATARRSAPTAADDDEVDDDEAGVAELTDDEAGVAELTDEEPEVDEPPPVKTRKAPNRVAPPPDDEGEDDPAPSPRRDAAARPAAARSPQVDDADYFDDDSPASRPAATAGRATAVAEDDDESESVATDPVISDKQVASEKKRQMAAADAAAARAGARTSTSQAPPKAAPPKAAPPKPAPPKSAPPASKGGTAKKK
jgi:hypothetical protein